MNRITANGGTTVDTLHTHRITREQMEAMDDTMKFDARKVLQMHRPHDLQDHFAPGVIDAPDKKGGRLVVALIALVLCLVGLTFGAFAGTKFTGWLSSIDWTPLAYLVGKQ